ncbi:MAG: hypothetical protein AAFQ05_00180 [Pseudomonadota bacterium]
MTTKEITYSFKKLNAAGTAVDPAVIFTLTVTVDTTAAKYADVTGKEWLGFEIQSGTASITGASSHWSVVVGTGQPYYLWQSPLSGSLGSCAGIDPDGGLTFKGTGYFPGELKWSPEEGHSERFFINGYFPGETAVNAQGYYELVSTDFTCNLGNGRVKLQEISLASKQAPEVLLRMQGVDNPSPVAAGFGTVNCQHFFNDDASRNPWEMFNLWSNDDGTFALESNQYANNVLRMAVEQGGSSEHGGKGTVNCQCANSPNWGDIGPWERLVLRGQSVSSSGTFWAVESAQFKGNYLRLNSLGQTEPADAGFGLANTNDTITDYEQFSIVYR